jgi:hypothetical protein
VGVGLGLLFAPRRGSETRKGVGNGYRRAKGTVGHWANRGRGMYATTREKVTKGARGTAGYVRDVADAVRMKNRPPSSGHPRKVV